MVDSLLLRCFFFQLLVCEAVSAVESVDISGAGRSFRLPRSNNGTGSVYHLTLRLWAVPVRAAKLSNQREMYDRRPLKLESYLIFSPAYVWPYSAKDGSEIRL